MAEQGDEHNHTVILLKAACHEVIEDKALYTNQAYFDYLMIIRP
jgi:hypothetical protein